MSDGVIIGLVKDRLKEPDCPTATCSTASAHRAASRCDERSEHDVDYWKSAFPTTAIIERMSGRRVHPASGRSYLVKFNPPKVEGKDDATGEDLVQRPDDTEETVKKRLTVYHDKPRFWSATTATGRNRATRRAEISQFAVSARSKRSGTVLLRAGGIKKSGLRVRFFMVVLRSTNANGQAAKKAIAVGGSYTVTRNFAARSMLPDSSQWSDHVSSAASDAAAGIAASTRAAMRFQRGMRGWGALTLVSKSRRIWRQVLWFALACGLIAVIYGLVSRSRIRRQVRRQRGNAKHCNHSTGCGSLLATNTAPSALGVVIVIAIAVVGLGVSTAISSSSARSVGRLRGFIRP